MAHKTLSNYLFCVGSDYHDSIIKIEAFTKADATKKARAYKVRKSDHVNFIEQRPLCTWIPDRGWVDGDGKGY